MRPLLDSARSPRAAAAHALKHLRPIISTIQHAYLRRPRWARLTLLTIAAAFGLLIALNGILNLGQTRPFLARLISVSPQSLSVDYRRAWSFWPTLIHVRDLRVRGSDDNVQWQLDVDEARASIDLTALLGRQFHLTKVRARGIGFRLRQKVDPPAATKDRLAPLAPMSGILGPPVRESGPPIPDIPDEKYDLWTVRIEDVEGRAKQLWVDEFHFEGDVTVAGAFFLRPKRWLWVGPAHANIHSGNISIGDEKLLNGIRGSATCSVPPFDPRPPTGMEFFRFMSGTVAIDSEVASARALDYYARIRGSSTVFDGGMGKFHVNGALRSGVLHLSSMSMTLSDIQARTADWLALGSLAVSAANDAEGRSAWLVRIAPVELRQADAVSTAVHATEVRLSARSDEIDLSKPAPDFELHGDLPAVTVPSLRIVNTLLRGASALRVDGGTGSISAHFDANTGTRRATGDVVASAKGISVRVGDLHIGGRFNSSAHISSAILDDGILDISSAFIDAREVVLRDPNAAVSDWWSHVQFYDVKFRPGQRTSLDLLWTAKAQNAAPVLAFSSRTPSVPGWITRLLAGGEVDASGRLLAGSTFVELLNFRAHTGLLTVEGRLRKRGESKSGVFRVTSGPLSVGIELKNDQTNVILIGSAVEPPLDDMPVVAMHQSVRENAKRISTR